MTITSIETAAETPPSRGDSLLHPGLDSSLLRHLIHPDRALWTPRELRDVTRSVTEELTTDLLKVLQYNQSQRWWLRIGLTVGVELWLLSWTPGQQTAPHDHNGAAGSFSMLTGALHEDYRYPGGPIRAAEYQVGAGIGFGGGRAHQVRNDRDRNAASVHAYSPPLLPTREYPSLAEIESGPHLQPADHSPQGTLAV